MYNKIRPLIMVIASLSLLWSCESKLDLNPEDKRQSSEDLNSVAQYRQFAAKVYAGLAISGQEGPAGDPDLIGLDEGFSQYVRLYWEMQELTTDEAIIGWNDGTIKDLHTQTWTSGNEFISTMYSRLLYQIALANEFIRQSSDENLDAHGISPDDRDQIATYRAEVRFLRALSYYHALDLFGNPPFITEDDPVGAYLPPQISRAELFTYIEQELKEIEPMLVDARQNEYGRVDKAADWMLLANLYLNSEVYIGESHYDEVINYTNKIINSGYSLVSDYQNLFLADNNTNGAQNEVIFPIAFDGINTQSYGGMTFLIHAQIGGDMLPADFGVDSGWAGLRTTPSLIDNFLNEETSAETIDEVGDSRALFFTKGQSKEIDNVSSFNDGYAVTKYKNIDVNGNPGSDPAKIFPDTDFPLFRLGDVYLMYAEAVVRGGNGSMGDAVSYVNKLRERAYGNTSHNISSSDLTLNFILAERGRELFWEAHRRTDLIRFGKFSDQGVWAWKGGSSSGSTTEAYRDLMPIPAADLGVNTNLEQNPGY